MIVACEAGGDIGSPQRKLWVKGPTIPSEPRRGDMNEWLEMDTTPIMSPAFAGFLLFS